MRKYDKNYLISIQDNFNYRIDFLIRLVTGFLFSYAIVAVWYVITDANSGTATRLKWPFYFIVAAIFGEKSRNLQTNES